MSTRIFFEKVAYEMTPDQEFYGLKKVHNDLKKRRKVNEGRGEEKILFNGLSLYWKL